MSGQRVDDEWRPPGVDVATLTLPVSKATATSRLSPMPRYFSRVLHELDGAGLIAIDKRHFCMMNAKRLAG